LRSDVADRRIERVDDVKESHPPGAACERDLARHGFARTERVEREVGRRITDLQLLADYSEANFAFEGFSRPGFRHAGICTTIALTASTRPGVSEGVIPVSRVLCQPGAAGGDPRHSRVL